MGKFSPEIQLVLSSGTVVTMTEEEYNQVINKQIDMPSVLMQASKTKKDWFSEDDIIMFSRWYETSQQTEGDTGLDSPEGTKQRRQAEQSASGYTPTEGGDTDLAMLIRREAERVGINPIDLATVISYETAGTFNPKVKGPKTKWGQHIGLVQMGEPQQQQYGYNPEGSLDSQMKAVGDYLIDRGVKPGMQLLDVYSTVNAGAPGLYNRSDEAAGGAPGTVRDKVETQMDGHRQKAIGLLDAGIGDLIQ